MEKFGPFNTREIKILEDLFKGHAIVYNLIPDQDLLQALEEEMKAKGLELSQNRTQNYNPSYIFIEVGMPLEDSLMKSLERFGIFLSNSEEPSFAEEYICPKCNFIQLEPGVCPDNHGPLIEYYQYLALTRKSTGSKKNELYFFLLLFGAIASLVFFLKGE